MIALPPPTRAWLVATIERMWPEPGPVVSALPDALPPGEVHRLASGGPFGLMIDGRLDEVEGRIALEVLENSRMSGERYFRVWDDGTVEELQPAPQIGYGYATPDEEAAAREAYFAHNRRAYAHLKARGFMQR